jgi:hypothetical protein
MTAANCIGDLSGPAREAWRRYLQSPGVIVRELNAGLLAEHGISSRDYDALLCLAQAEGRKLTMYLELFLVPERRDSEGRRFPAEPMLLPKTLRQPIEMPPEDEEDIPCMDCGAENPAESTFCAACGKPLRDEGERTVARETVPPLRVGAEELEETSEKTVLSDPAIRFQELLKMTLFRSLLDEKNVRLKDEKEVEDG